MVEICVCLTMEHSKKACTFKEFLFLDLLLRDKKSAFWKWKKNREVSKKVQFRFQGQGVLQDVENSSKPLALFLIGKPNEVSVAVKFAQRFLETWPGSADFAQCRLVASNY